MKVALVHDWFAVNAGAERVVEQILKIYPQTDVFSLVNFFNQVDRKKVLNGNKVETSFIQNLPFSKKKFRNYLALFPYAIQTFNLEDYDLIISSSHAVAKGIKTGADQLHISYCHTPMRYAWDLYDQYFNHFGFKNTVKKSIGKVVIPRLKKWDYATAQKVNYFVANSTNVAKRIENNYGRSSAVIHPPVNTDYFQLEKEKGDYYLTASRMVPYKRMDLVINAFEYMPDKKLIAIGNGSEFDSFKKSAPKNVQVMNYKNAEELRSYMQKAKAYVYAGEEDFGITMAEAQACGTPVIAYYKGGAADIVQDGQTGFMFKEQSAKAIAEIITKKEAQLTELDPEAIRASAMQFSEEQFLSKFKHFVDQAIEEFHSSVQ